ncbi:MAG: PA2169 family four-helix-bundle protein [Chitinophagaceae bacterium]|nr:PA2169 family four-helix-bundle protein [Chitinophagaceae bacterium]
MTNESQIEVLNDLVRINNDRIEGYGKAIENMKEDNGLLNPLFSSLQQDSRKNNQDLNAEISKLGGTPDTGTTTGGKIYRAWMDVKATFGGDDAKAILESCEGGEDAAKRAYQTAMESGDLAGDTAALVARQQGDQRAAHDKIKALRDQYKG